MVQSNLNFTYEMVLSHDLKYGNPINETKNWSGIIGMLQRNEADMTIMDLTVLLERIEVVFVFLVYNFHFVEIYQQKICAWSFQR